MTPLVIAQIIAGYGLPLAQQLYSLFHSGNQPVTQADFDALIKLGQYRSADSLAAAGIAIVDGKVVPISPVPAV
jgi:hypothetical protein